MAAGRPKNKQKKIKVGFSVSEECRDSIDTIAENTGKTKGRIIEEAIVELSKIKGFEK